MLEWWHKQRHLSTNTGVFISFSLLGEEEAQEDLINKYLREGGVQRDEARLSPVVPKARTREMGTNWSTGDSLKHFCAVQVAEYLHRLPRGCGVSSLGTFQSNGQPRGCAVLGKASHGQTAQSDKANGRTRHLHAAPVNTTCLELHLGTKLGTKGVVKRKPSFMAFLVHITA